MHVVLGLKEWNKMGNQLKKSMWKFYRETNTPPGNFWKNSADDIEKLTNTVRLANGASRPEATFASLTIQAGVDGSNCPLLAAERRGVVSYVKQHLSTADEVFVGRCRDSSTSPYCDRTHNYISISDKYIDALAVYAASIVRFEKLDDATRSASVPHSAMAEAKLEFDEIVHNHIHGAIAQSRGSSFVKEMMGEFAAVHLSLASKAEAWMIAHEYGHLIERKQRAKLRAAAEPLMSSLIEVPVLLQEYSKWKAAWQEEFWCDVLACQYLLRDVDPELKSEASYANLMSALQSPLIALTCAETLLRQQRDIEVDESHPSPITRIVMLIFVVVRTYGTHMLRKNPIRSLRGDGTSNINLFYFCSSLLEYVSWILDDQERSARQFPGVRAEMTRSEATEYRYEKTYNFLVELSAEDIAVDEVKYGEYWLSLGNE